MADLASTAVSGHSAQRSGQRLPVHFMHTSNGAANGNVCLTCVCVKHVLVPKKHPT